MAHLSRAELNDLRSDTTSDAPDAVSIEDGEKSPLVSAQRGRGTLGGGVIGGTCRLSRLLREIEG